MRDGRECDDIDEHWPASSTSCRRCAFQKIVGIPLRFACLGPPREHLHLIRGRPWRSQRFVGTLSRPCHRRTSPAGILYTGLDDTTDKPRETSIPESHCPPRARQARTRRRRDGPTSPARRRLTWGSTIFEGAPAISVTTVHHPSTVATIFRGKREEEGRRCLPPIDLACQHNGRRQLMEASQ